MKQTLRFVEKAR